MVWGLAELGAGCWRAGGLAGWVGQPCPPPLRVPRSPRLTTLSFRCCITPPPAPPRCACLQLVLPTRQHRLGLQQLQRDLRVLHKMRSIDYSLLLGVHFLRWGNAGWHPPGADWPPPQQGQQQEQPAAAVLTGQRRRGGDAAQDDAAVVAAAWAAFPETFDPSLPEQQRQQLQQPPLPPLPAPLAGPEEGGRSSSEQRLELVPSAGEAQAQVPSSSLPPRLSQMSWRMRSSSLAAGDALAEVLQGMMDRQQLQPPHQEGADGQQGAAEQQAAQPREVDEQQQQQQQRQRQQDGEAGVEPGHVQEQEEHGNVAKSPSQLAAASLVQAANRSRVQARLSASEAMQQGGCMQAAASASAAPPRASLELTPLHTIAEQQGPEAAPSGDAEAAVVVAPAAAAAVVVASSRAAVPASSSGAVAQSGGGLQWLLRHGCGLGGGGGGLRGGAFSGCLPATARRQPVCDAGANGGLGDDEVELWAAGAGGAPLPPQLNSISSSVGAAAPLGGSPVSGRSSLSEPCSPLALAPPPAEGVGQVQEQQLQQQQLDAAALPQTLLLEQEEHRAALARLLSRNTTAGGSVSRERDSCGRAVPAVAVRRTSSGALQCEPVLLFFGVIDFLQVTRRRRGPAWLHLKATRAPGRGAGMRDAPGVDAGLPPTPPPPPSYSPSAWFPALHGCACRWCRATAPASTWSAGGKRRCTAARRCRWQTRARTAAASSGACRACCWTPAAVIS